MLSDTDQPSKQDDDAVVQRSEIVRGWWAVGALALLSAWWLGSALLIVAGLAALAVGVIWRAVPADTRRRVLRDDQIS